MGKKAVIYTRISQDRTGAGLGTQRQEADCRELAANLGWTVSAVFTDDDVSAYSGKPRPAYRRMLETLEAKQASGVLIWHTDRLHRSPRELENYIDVAEKHGVTTQAVRSGELDLSTPTGRMVARILGSIARGEVEHKSDRTRRAQKQAAEAGKFLGGTRPFGWDLVDGVPVANQVEAAAVREAVQSVLSGYSVGSVVRDLNSRNVLTTTGKQWNYSTLRQVLTRPRNAGLSTWHGELVGPSKFPAIITEDEHRAVVHLFANPDRRKSQSNRVKYLVAGIARCGACGAVMRSATASSGPSRRLIYRCATAGRGHAYKSLEPVDDLVSRVVLGILSQNDLMAAYTARDGSDAEALQGEALALRARLADAALSFADGAINRSQMEQITDRVNAKLADVTGRMSQSSVSAVLRDFTGDQKQIRRVWDDSTVERRRAVVDALCTVTIDPTPPGSPRVFDPETVRIEWRTE